MIEEDGDDTIHKAFVNISEKLECDTGLVYKAFETVPIPMWHTPENLKSSAEEAEILLKIERHLNAALKEYQRLPNSVYSWLIHAGTVTKEQISHSAGEVWGLGHFLREHSKKLPRRGGKNWAADYVSIGIRNLFDHLGLKVTFGHYEGRPTTEFGKMVEYAMEQLRVDGNWRDPASRAAKRTEID